MSTNFPLLFGSTGPIATPPASLLAALIAYVQSQQPGYTANLPGSLIDDISGTDVGALVAIDQARVDAVNSVSPYGANAYLLNQLGAMFGLPQGMATNANVYLVFTGTAGYVIPPGFVCSDGTNEFVVQDGGVVATGGTSSPIYAVCNNPNVFSIPAGSVTTVVTTVPSPYTLTVTNPQAGTQAQSAESTSAYRARLLQAYQIGITGWQTYLKTLLYAIPGVATRLVSVVPNSTNWEVICGGGDSYEIGQAIYAATSNIGWIVGSGTSARNVSVALYDAPNTYTVVYVNPPQQSVTVDVTWNTTLTGFTATAAVNQYIIAAVQAYINAIVVGQPINLLQLNEAVQVAVSPVLAAVNLTTLSYVVKYSGVTQSPTAGTSIIPAPDDETYLYISPTGVTSTQG